MSGSAIGVGGRRGIASSALLVAGCWAAETPAPPPAAPPVAPTELPRTLRTGPVDPAAIGTMEESPRGCNFFLSIQPGGGVAPVAALPGACPAWFEIAWDGKRLVMLDDGVPTLIGKREANRLPEPPLSSAITVHGEDIVVCGTGEEEWLERGGRIVFDTDEGKVEAPAVDGALGYALARSFRWTGNDWTEVEVGVVPTWTVMADAACTALPGWPAGSRLDPSRPRWRADDWAAPVGEDPALLAALGSGAWHVDPTRTVAVRGEWVGPSFTVSGPVALWVNDGWKTIAGTSQGELAFTIQSDWILYDAGGKAGLVSRRDGTQAWTDDGGRPVFLWPGDMAIPPERGERPPREREGEAREKPPRHERPEGRPGRPGHPDHPGRPQNPPRPGGERPGTRRPKEGKRGG